MAFFLRKSVSVGPFRFNLSKSGLGLSMGVKGLRVGSGPRGNYIYMGRNGVYYRRSLGKKGRAEEKPEQLPILEKSMTEAVEVEPENIVELQPSSSVDLVEQIRKKTKSIKAWPFLFVTGMAGTIYSSLNGYDISYVYAAAIVMGIATLIWRLIPLTQVILDVVS